MGIYSRIRCELFGADVTVKALQCFLGLKYRAIDLGELRRGVRGKNNIRSRQDSILAEVAMFERGGRAGGRVSG